MRLTVRKSLVVLALFLFFVPSASGDHFVSDCRLSLVGSAGPSTPFGSSPNGVFKNGSVIYSLRGDRLTTFSINDVGEVIVARDDEMSPFAARDVEGAVTYDAGYMYVSSEAGLEVFDLRTVQPGPFGTEPIRVSRTPGLHYRQMTASGNLLAGVYPMYDIPCTPRGFGTCGNSIDIYNIADPAAPFLVASIPSTNFFIGFNDIVFLNGYLYSTGPGGTYAFDVTNPANPTIVFATPIIGEFFVTNGGNLLGIGQESRIGVFTVGPGPFINQFFVFTLPAIVNRSNGIRFNREATFDGTHLITMIDEKDPMTGKSARTIAFDVFDFTVPFYEGSSPRIYEDVTFTLPDEIKHNPVVAGPFVYVNGEISGLQVWGACGQIAGAIESVRIENVPCGGFELRGFVTGATRITDVQIFLDGASLGMATVGGARFDISSKTPVVNWRLPVNLDNLTRGNHTIRAVATDADGNVRQFASKTIFSNGPGRNCTNRRRGAGR